MDILALFSNKEFLLRIAVLVALLVIGYLTVFRAASKAVLSRKPVGEYVILYGPSSSGKTALFYQLKTGQFKETVSSLKQNKCVITLTRSDEDVSSMEVVDYPGHEKLRQGLVKLLDRAKLIVFMIDPSDKAGLKDGAEKLFDLLSNEKLSAPVLLVLSKSDKANQKSLKYLMTELEREIERMRKSKDGEDGRFLGIDGKVFSFDQSPVPVKFTSCSAKTDDLHNLKKEILTIE